MNAQVENTAAALGIGVFELFSRARAGYGTARDSARTAYNLYLACGTVPDFVLRFLTSTQAGSNGHAHASMPVGRQHGGHPRRIIG